jgi:hypothetical protein
MFYTEYFIFSYLCVSDDFCFFSSVKRRSIMSIHLALDACSHKRFLKIAERTHK